jgi:hypothetical protein
MAITKERKAEICVCLLDHMSKKKFRSQLEGFSRDLGNIAKETGIPLDELKSLMRPMILSALDEIFPADKSVSVCNPDANSEM